MTLSVIRRSTLLGLAAVLTLFKVVECGRALDECATLVCPEGARPQIEQVGVWGTYVCVGCPAPPPCTCTCPDHLCAEKRLPL